ncbi:hypothetical protein B0H10DRAFT_1984469 [Mycena sp. CBHHK59/15]|nr:hypothetical protein B0H10DRAFT_1984469 [Mycena sp. CBHHK59/15]
MKIAQGVAPSIEGPAGTSARRSGIETPRRQHSRVNGRRSDHAKRTDPPAPISIEAYRPSTAEMGERPLGAARGGCAAPAKECAMRRYREEARERHTCEEASRGVLARLARGEGHAEVHAAAIAEGRGLLAQIPGHTRAGCSPRAPAQAATSRLRRGSTSPCSEPHRFHGVCLHPVAPQLSVCRPLALVRVTRVCTLSLRRRRMGAGGGGCAVDAVRVRLEELSAVEAHAARCAVRRGRRSDGSMSGYEQGPRSRPRGGARASTRTPRPGLGVAWARADRCARAQRGNSPQGP